MQLLDDIAKLMWMFQIAMGGATAFFVWKTFRSLRKMRAQAGRPSYTTQLAAWIADRVSSELKIKHEFGPWKKMHASFMQERQCLRCGLTQEINVRTTERTHQRFVPCIDAVWDEEDI